MATLDQSLVTFLATIVATSVFKISFVAHRSHLTLAEARRRVRDCPDRRAEEAELVDAVGSGLILGLNALLAVLLTAVATVILITKEGLTVEEQVVLAGLMIVEVTVVVVGSLDQRSASQQLSSGDRNESANVGATAQRADTARRDQ